MIEQLIEQNKKELLVEYKEVFANSFVDAVDNVIKDSDEKDFCLVDIDGTLINHYAKLPIVCHFVNVDVNESSVKSFYKLAECFHGFVGVFTNRNRWERCFWNSNKIIESIENLVKKSSYDIPIFTFLNRQIPGLARRRCDDLIQHIRDKGVREGKSKFNLYSIEDESMVCPGRGRFLKYVGENIRQEYGIDVSIKNFVICE